ncbi:MAG: hypothetical protein IPP14_10800 [Planctomycetes bacterium]|nr:hypothetical protein [Planctomycetota bacterium]
MPIEYVVIERIVNVHERHEQDRSNPGFSGVDVEAMTLRNYGEKNWVLTTVLTEPVSHDQFRRVFYFQRST